jgi:hypothetical protein
VPRPGSSGYRTTEPGLDVADGLPLANECTNLALGWLVIWMVGNTALAWFLRARFDGPVIAAVLLWLLLVAAWSSVWFVGSSLIPISTDTECF